MASSINHPNICTIYDIGEHEGQPFIAMELLVGQTLKQVIAANTLKENHVLEYAIQIVDALHAAHGNGTLHRDIKPANIFITQSGHVKLLDFGLAKPFAIPQKHPATESTLPVSDITKPGQPIGTILYMSPEQARAYWAEYAGQRDLWTVAPDGGAPVRVTNDAHLDWNPVWSPDGMYLYFSSDRGGTANIWRVPMDRQSGGASGAPQAMTTAGLGSRHHFSLSKDGRRLAYVEAEVRLNLEKIRFVDRITKRTREVLNASPKAIDVTFDLSAGNRILYFTSIAREADIWLLTLP